MEVGFGCEDESRLLGSILGHRCSICPSAFTDNCRDREGMKISRKDRRRKAHVLFGNGHECSNATVGDDGGGRSAQNEAVQESQSPPRWEFYERFCLFANLNRQWKRHKILYFKHGE